MLRALQERRAQITGTAKAVSTTPPAPGVMVDKEDPRTAASKEGTRTAILLAAARWRHVRLAPLPTIAAPVWLLRGAAGAMARSPVVST